MQKRRDTHLGLKQAVLHGLGDVQIANFDAAVLRQEAVGRFQVSVHDVLRVQVLQRVRHLVIHVLLWSGTSVAQCDTVTQR